VDKYKIVRGGLHHRFLQCRKKIQVLAGGFGNGKTAAVCVRAIQLCMDYPGCNGLIARETYPKLNDTIRKEFYKWCPHSAVKRWPTKDDNTLIFKNGSTVNFRYIAQRGKASVDGITTSNLLSATYDWAIVDQMEDPLIQYKDFLDLLGRLRGSTPYKGSDRSMPMTGPRWLIMTANPTANWFYKKIVKPFHKYRATGTVAEDLLHDPVTMEPIIEVLEGSTYENKHNLEQDFLTGLEASYQGQMRNRFLMGEWAAYEGLVYPEFNPLIHMIPRSDMNEILDKAVRSKSPLDNVEGFDFGIVSPSCYLGGFVDYYGRVFIMDGFYKPNMSIDDIGSEILEKQERISYGVQQDNPIWCDPAIFKRTIVDGTGKTTDTVAKLLKNRFDLFLKPGQNVIGSGIMKVSEYLIPRVGMHYDSSQEKGPMIYFADDLSFIEDEFQTYFWKTNSEGERQDEPNDKNDHAMDVIKYMLSRLPEASVFNFRRPVLTPEYMKWQEVPN